LDEFWPQTPDGPVHDADPTGHLDPLLEWRVEQRPWEVRAAQWRARALAEVAFGEGVGVSLTGRVGYQAFRGLLTLTVPFRDLPNHRAREAVFLSWAGQDEVLARVPLIFVFEPVPVQ
jgi:hypothetical protein